MQKYLTFSVFPCILRKVGAVWLRQNIDPLEDTEIIVTARLRSHIEYRSGPEHRYRNL